MAAPKASQTKILSSSLKKMGHPLSQSVSTKKKSVKLPSLSGNDEMFLSREDSKDNNVSFLADNNNVKLQGLHKPMAILSALHFSLNPIFLKSKYTNRLSFTKTSTSPTLNSQKSMTQGQSNVQQKLILHQQSVTRKILEIRNRNLLAASNLSLQTKPKLKQARSICKGTISLLQNTHDMRQIGAQKSKSDFVQTASKNEISDKAKDKIRLQMIEWMRKNKMDSIQKINESKSLIVNWVQYVGYLDRSEFDHLLASIGIQNDKTLNDRLFWLFDLSSNNTIQSNEIVQALNLLKEYTFDEKINLFFSYCDDYRTGYINEQQLQEFMLKNLRLDEEKKILKLYIKDFVRHLNCRNPNKISKEDLHIAAFGDHNLNVIIDKNIQRNVQTDKKTTKFNSMYLISGQLENQTGVFYPYMDQLGDIVAKKEFFHNQYSMYKQQYMNMVKSTKALQNNDSSDDEFGY